MLGIDLALIGSIVIGVPVCAYAIWKDCTKKKEEPSPKIVKQIKAEDGSIIKIEVDNGVKND